jgi:putative aminopeptidase FrvX
MRRWAFVLWFAWVCVAQAKEAVPPRFPSGPVDAELRASLPKDAHFDSFGNAWVTSGSGSPHYLVVVRRDTPGYVVSSNTPDGYLRLQRLGTPATPLFDQFMVGRRVLVYTKNGPLPAVVGCPSTHFRRGADVPVPEATVDDLWVDVGAESDRDAEAMGIALLDPVSAASTDPKLSTNATWSAGRDAGLRAVHEFAHRVTLGSAPLGKATRTLAFVSGGSEGGRGSRRLLATLPRPDTVFVYEPVVADGPDSTLRAVGMDGAGTLMTGPDTSLAARVAWAKQWKLPATPRPAYSADARVWSGAGIPTYVLMWPTAYFGSPTELVQRASDKISWEGAGASGWDRTEGEAHAATFRTLEPLLRAYGVSEHEEAVAAAVRAALPDGAREAATIDERGNVILRLGPGAPDRLFVAHQDEIGYRVTAVDGDGRARVQREGGFYDWLYEGEVVRVSRMGTEFEAIVPPRVGYRTTPRPVVARPLADEARPAMSAASRFDVTDVRIDAGATESATTPLKVGDDVTVRHEIARLGEHRISARAIDDRYGCAALVMAAKELWPKRKQLPSTVWLVWSVEEETGLKGAEWLADSLLHHGMLPKRVHAVDTFVSSDSPLEDPRYGDAKLGKGAVVRAVDTSHEAPIEAVRATLQLAKEKDIPLQYGVTSGGNDGVPFAERGSINVPLAWPLRYSHSAVEVADLRDLESLARLVTALSWEKATDDPRQP